MTWGASKHSERYQLWAQLDLEFDDEETAAVIEMFSKEIAEIGLIKGDALGQIAITLPPHQK